MDEFVVYIGWVTCAAGGLAFVAAAWWFALKMLSAALRDTREMAIFWRWAWIRYIRSFRRQQAKEKPRAR